MRTIVLPALVVMVGLAFRPVSAQGGQAFGAGGGQFSGGQAGGSHITDPRIITDSIVSRYLDGEETKSILTPGEFTEWNLDLKAGDVVVAEARSDFFDPALEVVDDKDKVLAFNDDRYPGDQRPLLLWRCTQDGAYRMHGRCFRDKAGGQMFLRYRTYRSIDLVPGKRVELSLEKSDRFLARIPMKSGQIVQVDDGRNGQEPFVGFVPSIVIAPTGVPNPDYIDSFKTVLEHAVYAPVDGDYYTFCTTYGVTEGKVAVKASELVASALDRTRGVGKGNGPASVLGLWKTSLKAGELLKFETPDLKPETMIVVAQKPEIAAYDPKKPETSPFNPRPVNQSSGERILLMKGRNLDGRIAVVRALQDCDVWVAVRPSKKTSETYSLNVGRAASDFPTGPKRVSTLAIGGTDYWEFEGTVGEVVTVRSEVVPFAQALVLYGPDGQAVWNRFTGVDELKIEQTTVVTKPGRYVLAVAAQGDGGSGDYLIERSVAAVKTFGKTSPAKGDTSNGIQVWKFTLKPGDPALLHWQSDLWDYQILVCDANGNVVGLPMTPIDERNWYALLSTDRPKDYVIVLVPGQKGSAYTIELKDLPGYKGG